MVQSRMIETEQISTMRRFEKLVSFSLSLMKDKIKLAQQQTSKAAERSRAFGLFEGSSNLRMQQRNLLKARQGSRPHPTAPATNYSLGIA